MNPRPGRLPCGWLGGTDEMHYNPDAEHVVGDLPGGVVAEVERLAEQLAVLGRDACGVGRGPLEGGGLRTLDIFGAGAS
ncbi:hypothetical protein ACFWFZ_11150 [Streptomyces sp. NPDC060232]|uniref:hypothetical protein n=1 Tax=Streptomyces sp. NPDC060232 TaxID=3347079 RepID=UPI00364A174A